MKPFEELLQESVALHGHFCAGQVIGVRMAMVGCEAVGVEEPASSKKLLVYVEIDRCAADAVQSVTGCKLGKRTLKFMDYGKMAATFLNTETGKAVRVLARDDARDAAWAYAPAGASKKDAQLAAYQRMPVDQLFVLTPVRLKVLPEDMPGHPLSRVTCEVCGEGVNDRREVVKGGRTLCRPCALGGYYSPLPSAPLRVGPFALDEAPR
jgi:formylmethanofuran dehydrogenase subunit E